MATLANRLRALGLALINATLLLALGLVLAAHLLVGRVEALAASLRPDARLEARFAQAATRLDGLEARAAQAEGAALADELAGLRAEVAGLRADLAEAGAAGGVALARAALSELGELARSAAGEMRR